jgi:hypothetical protein
VGADDQGKVINMGAHFHTIGGGSVDRMNLCFRKSKDSVELTFSLTHLHRSELEGREEKIQTLFEDPKELTEFLFLNGISTDIKMTGDSLSPTLAFEGNELSMRKDKKALSSYDRIRVKIPLDGEIKDVHTILSVYGLSDVLKKSSEEEIEKMKLMQLFHMLCPREAYDFERSRHILHSDMDQLKGKMIHLNSSMRQHIDRYLSGIELKEIFPGKKRCYVNGLVDDIKEKLFDLQFALRANVAGADGWEDLPTIVSMSHAE